MKKCVHIIYMNTYIIAFNQNSQKLEKNKYPLTGEKTNNTW